MAVELQRVIERFKPKFGTLSIPQPKVEAMAAKFALLIPDEATDEGIDTFLDTMNEAYDFKEVAASEHRKQQPPKPTPKPNPAPADPKPTDDPKPDDAPAWAQTIIKSLETTQAELQALKAEKTQTTIQAKVAELAKDIPSSFLKGKALPDSLENAQAWVDEQKAAYTEFQQEYSNNNIGAGKPAWGSQKANKDEEPSAEMKQYLAENKKQEPTNV